MARKKPTPERLERYLNAVAQLVEIDPVYLPILERLEAEYRLAKAPPLERVRGVIQSQAAVAL